MSTNPVPDRIHASLMIRLLCLTCSVEAFPSPVRAPPIESERERTIEQLKHMHAYVRSLRVHLRNLLAESDSKKIKI